MCFFSKPASTDSSTRTKAPSKEMVYIMLFIISGQSKKYLFSSYLLICVMNESFILKVSFKDSSFIFGNKIFVNCPGEIDLRDPVKWKHTYFDKPQLFQDIFLSKQTNFESFYTYLFKSSPLPSSKPSKSPVTSMV